MENSNPAFQSQIRIVSVLAGITVTLGLLFFFMSVASGVGVNQNTESLAPLGGKVWVATSIAWALSSFGGTFVTILASRISDLRSALLNSITTWAGSFVLFGGVSQAITESMILPLQIPTTEFYRMGFTGDLASLVASLLAGILAFALERGIVQRREYRKSFSSSAPGLPLNMAPLK